MVAGIVVAVDPHPFAWPGDAPSVALAPAIDGATATTMPAPRVPRGDSLRFAALDAPETPTLATTVTERPSTEPPTTAPPAPSPEPTTVAPASVPTRAPAVVAKVKVPVLMIYPAEGASQPNVAFYGTTELGTPRVLLTTAVRGQWTQVLMPTRPNGSTGWIHTADADLSTIDDAVDVDLAARTLTWTRGNQVVLRVPSAVGARSTPTPTGTFFVTDVLPYDPNGPDGAWVIALNAHSDAYASFEGGDARIAIHGTNDPSSIGAAVSNGCVRVDAGPLDALRAQLPLGTPVTVH
jgi:lipoprotein-anchoring transpeptidase ErfK/SrfK